MPGLHPNRTNTSIRGDFSLSPPRYRLTRISTSTAVGLMQQRGTVECCLTKLIVTTKAALYDGQGVGWAHTLPGASTVAPWASSSSSTSLWPLEAAFHRGVLASAFRMSTMAP